MGSSFVTLTRTLAGDLYAEHPLWNSAISNPSGEKLLAMFDIDFEISVPQCPTHYFPAGNGDVLKMSGCQRSLSLTSWTQTTHQSFSTHWIMLELNIFWILLKKHGSGFKALPLM
jgi:hypothetical protein